jgi:hypothetical protein
VSAIYHEVGVRHGSRLSLEQVSARFREAFSRSAEANVLACDCETADEPWHTCESRERLRWKSIVEAVLDDVVEARPLVLRNCLRILAGLRPGSVFPRSRPRWLRCVERGFRLAVSSNFDARLNTVMDGLSALRSDRAAFHLLRRSDYRKPSRRFFESLLLRTGCRAGGVALCR